MIKGNHHSHRCKNPPPQGGSILSATHGVKNKRNLTFPTQVGMFRLRAKLNTVYDAIPHPSGDVPSFNGNIKRVVNYSPPKWGCSADGLIGVCPSVLFPTQVGMFRKSVLDFHRTMTIPHPSGDVPPEGFGKRKQRSYSPPKWGCAERAGGGTFDAGLFPTQVGMFRFSEV